MENILFAALGVIIASFLVSSCVYPYIPDDMATHWDINGRVDGYMPKYLALFIMPILSIGLLLIFLALPAIDPLKRNIRSFRKYFDLFIFVLMAFLFYLHILTIFWGMGFMFNIVTMMSPGFAVLYYCIGAMVQNARRNWFIGFRTPWTMSSDRVWQKTHRLGGRLMKACGLIALLGAFILDYAFILIIGPVIAVAIYVTAYSYMEYRKLGKK